MGPRFHGREHFAPKGGGGSYRLLPFRFGQLDLRRYVVMNDVGEHVVLAREELVAFARHQLSPASEVYRALKVRHFLFDADSECALDLLALKYRTRADRIADFTGLHIFVVTLRCDHSCHYCQVSRQTEDKSAFDMSREHAERALALTFRSPARSIKIEFQGGEPLLHFDLVRFIVERATALNEEHRRDLQFVIASNLARITDDMLAFCKQYGIHFSTSLDGPEAQHDAHRPLRGGKSHARVLEGIRRVRAALGHDAVSALMTTTPSSLGQVEAIVDEYVRQGFRSIFLRSLSPYGFAVRTSLVRKYGVDDWLDFYRRGLAYILELNRRGCAFQEEYTTILLQKLFSAQGSSYVDLQSPAGIGIGGIVYNYDGAVYASDEGRMLAEMGDGTFELGHLGSDTYEAMLTNDAFVGILQDTLLESSPMCSDCPFLACCGADPVFHQVTSGDPVGHKAFSAFCAKQMGVMRHLITLLEDDPEARRILMGWV
ncbi:His-Xaa-Ser system radical SAM maturase HxsB [Pendulispora albinea]|uniref:His-Xaa-Ser system radical SAM maturase HxsB n=1 Tax=Pendulispora albinea TaxID=2741071 RepID=A0ABZ2M1M4_9BACT